MVREATRRKNGRMLNHRRLAAESWGRIPYLSRFTAGTSVHTGTGPTRRTFLVNSGRVLLVGAGLAGGLGRVRVAGAASQVTLGLASVPCQAPAYAAVAQGFFTDEGLDVAVVTFPEVGEILPALTSGRIDVGLTTVWNVVPPRLTAGKALGDVVITAPLQRGCLALSVPADSDIQTLAELRGQTVAGVKFLYGRAILEAGVDPDTEITWAPAPTAANVFATLQTGEFAAVQSPDGQGALLEVVGAGRMIGMNNMPPADSFYCCASVMNASSITADRPRAAAITRALMRGSAWSEENRTETAELMRPAMTLPAQRDITQEDMEAALAMQAFIPMAEAARPILVEQFIDYVSYGLPVTPPVDAATLVDRIFVPVTDELRA
jgi:ABC-type nitrate/sulfonate/bicarbonate transport system substrate-binding protein